MLPEPSMVIPAILRNAAFVAGPLSPVIPIVPLAAFNGLCANVPVGNTKPKDELLASINPPAELMNTLPVSDVKLAADEELLADPEPTLAHAEPLALSNVLSVVLYLI